MRCHGGIDPAFFILNGGIVFVMHHAGVENRALRRDIQCGSQLGGGCRGFSGQHAAAVAVAAAFDFGGNAVDFKQRRLRFGRRHKSAHPLQTHQAALVGELAQGAVDRHARHLELRHQLVFGRQAVVHRPQPLVDLAEQVGFYFLIKRLRNIGGHGD